MNDELDIHQVQQMLEAWGACINGGLPGGYGQPGLYQDTLRDESWCPQADEIEVALRHVRSRKDGMRKAEVLRLHYGTSLFPHEVAKKMRMTNENYEIYLNAAERLIMHVLTRETA